MSSSAIAWRPFSGACKLAASWTEKFENYWTSCPAFSAGHPPLNNSAERKARMVRHHKSSSSSGGSQRQLRVGEIVRHAMAALLAQGSAHDADLEGHIITVPE